jgi:hypothetical protein
VADITLLLICPSKSLFICHRQQINNVDRQTERNLTSKQADLSLYCLNQNSSNYLPDDSLTDQSINEVVVFSLINPQYR